MVVAITFTGYFVLHFIIIRGAKESLLSKKYLIENQIQKTGEIPGLYPIIEVQKTQDTSLVEPSFREMIFRNEMENEDEVFLEYSDKIKANDSYYLIKLRYSTFENEDLLLIMVLTLFILISSAFIISFFITKRMNRTVWADFEYNLHEIEKFNLRTNEQISLVKSDTDEFERLNRIINSLTDKLKADYHSLKEFTENASHEIQTPLMIALLNLEEILQQDIEEGILKKVGASISALKRLSALNKNLLLLTKIENNQFIADKEVSFEEIAARKTDEFSLLFEAKALDVQVQVDHDFMVRINDQLADILINNLFSNAINHNISGGIISIFIQESSFRICNSGETNLLTDETIFNRFVRGNLQSYGLGLAIVKGICETNNLDIHYYKGELHCFEITRKT
jgi:signal transduction histidine kinase